MTLLQYSSHFAQSFKAHLWISIADLSCIGVTCQIHTKIQPDVTHSTESCLQILCCGSKGVAQQQASDLRRYLPRVGRTWVPTSSDGRCTVLEVWLCTDSSAEAQDIERALKIMQQRIYPDILALSRAFTAYSELYEQCKTGQIEACARYSSAYSAVQVQRS